MSLHTGKGRTVGTAISDILEYVENPEKTDNGRLISSYQCDSRIADAEFLFAKKRYIAKTGRVRGADDVIAYHLRQSFPPGEITPEEANRLGRELAMRFTKGNHAFIVCTHIDKAHVHNHIIWNSTALDSTRKFRDFLGSAKAVRRLSDTICVENGYSIVANPNQRGKTYDEWLGDKPPSHRDQLRMAIDAALAQKPADMEALWTSLRDAGIEVERRGKSVRLKASGRKKFVRVDAHSLGEEYDLPALEAVLKGLKTRRPQAKTPRVNLLVDIQAKLQEGKGAGYARWARSFNLKQMARTLNYLTERGLMDYADLTEKTSAATVRYHELADKIKAAEQRMTEIAAMRTQIINYVKTRDVYASYRKAGYSKKFREEHESEILLHQAAKKFFNGQGLEKLPTVKSLQAEYSALLAEKKAAYADYRKARDEMRELLAVKANVDRMLNRQEKEPAKEAQPERETKQETETEQEQQETEPNGEQPQTPETSPQAEQGNEAPEAETKKEETRPNQRNER